MKVLIIDTMHHALQEILEENGHECLDMSASSESEVFIALPFAEILILRSRMNIGHTEIDACPNLKIIGRVGAGLEHINVDYAQSKGIKVLNSPEGNRQAVAEHALGMLLALFNHIPSADTEVRKGVWDRKKNQGIELSGKTVGVVGFGNTGSAFVNLLAGFGVNVLIYDKYISDYSDPQHMQSIWDRADVISLHIPYNREVHHLVSEDWLSRFKKPIYLINTSRGSIVDTHALLNALESKKILGACLDVLEYETETLQMPEANTLPKEAQQLFGHPNVVLTPHLAGLTRESYEKLSKILAEKILSEIA